MVELLPFASPAPVRIQAGLTLGPEWRLRFVLKDPLNLTLDSPREGKWSNWDRADELWKTTCFEAFWGTPGETGYWEINLSPSNQLWNLYRFERYRAPQPPTRSFDFELADIVAGSDSLECILRPNVKLESVEIGLTAIVRTKDQTHYFATKHTGEKADFHRRENFALVQS